MLGKEHSRYNEIVSIHLLMARRREEGNEVRIALKVLILYRKNN